MVDVHFPLPLLDLAQVYGLMQWLLKESGMAFLCCICNDTSFELYCFFVVKVCLMALFMFTQIINARWTVLKVIKFLWKFFLHIAHNDSSSSDFVCDALMLAKGLEVSQLQVL